MTPVAAHRAIGQFAALVLLAVIFGVGCGRGAGSEFLGKWEDVKNPSDTVEILKNGDQFLVVHGNEKIGAVLKDGSLEIAGMMGAIRVTHIKSSDTLTVPGFGGTQEYKRKK